MHFEAQSRVDSGINQQAPQRSRCHMWKVIKTMLRAASSVSVAGVFILLLSGCQPPNPAGPTPIPSPTQTAEATATIIVPTNTAQPQSSESPPPSLPPLRPLVTSTALAQLSTAVQAQQAAPTATLGPICLTVKKGETLGGLIFRAGYNDYGPIDEVRQLNGIEGNNIQEGQKVCIPRPTATPTPTGYDKTLTALPTQFQVVNGPLATTIYKVKDKDTVGSIVLTLGISLRTLCQLNPPPDFNCAPCNLDAPYGQWNCRPTIRIGQELKIPGPTPTPTITATYTGSETPTPTPSYDQPRLVAPVLGDVRKGTVQLSWLPTSGLLQPDEFYLVIWQDMGTNQAGELTTQATSLRLPASFEPSDGQPHQINWRVVVARQQGDQYIEISPPSAIYSFSWQSR